MQPLTNHTLFLFRFFSREHLICEVSGKEKSLCLTFDDGPVPEVTPVILQILRERCVKALFFMVGENVQKNPGLFQAVVEEGHTIGNHTYHHLDGWKTPPAAYVEDVTRCNGLVNSRLFRPPYGRFTPSQYLMLRKKYRFVMWSVLTQDYAHHITPEKCLDIALKSTCPGSIIVFHDSLKASEKILFALPRFLDHCLEKGYRFEVL